MRRRSLPAKCRRRFSCSRVPPAYLLTRYFSCRLAKSLSGAASGNGQTSYVYDGDTVVEEIGPSGTTYELPGVGYVSSSSGTNTQNYYFDNALGSTLSVLNSAGASQSRTEYDGYGITYPEVAGAQSDFRFAGGQKWRICG